MTLTTFALQLVALYIEGVKAFLPTLAWQGRADRAHARLKGKRHSEARKAAISAAKITCGCGECEKCKSRARQQKCRAKKAKKA
eukprot:XP_001702070.1 predicted protein [Chlamydomonas reinhardtii]